MDRTFVTWFASQTIVWQCIECRPSRSSLLWYVVSSFLFARFFSSLIGILLFLNVICNTGSIYNFTHPFYPFFGHPNGMGGTYGSAGKGHQICVIKQIKAFKIAFPEGTKDKTHLTPKRAKDLADFLRACAPYAYVEFGPKGVGNDHMTRK